MKHVFGRWIEWRADRIQDPIGRLRYLRSTTDRSWRQRRSRIGLRLGAVLLTAIGASCFLLRARMAAPPLPDFARRIPAPPAPGFEALLEVWPMEQNRDFETYSNGLRIENRHAV